MVRCLGYLKRVVQGMGWTLHVFNIRQTDWEEIRSTKVVAGAGII
jgi:hypothetical protein